MDFTSLPKVKYNESLLKDDLCLIDGDEHPQLVGKIVKMMSEGSQPRIFTLGDPGYGTTWTMARLGEILHEELDILKGDFQPHEQITQDPLKFINSVRTETKRIFLVPDADSVFPADEHYTSKNKGNRDVLYLSRRRGNLLGYDAHEMFRTDKGIRTNHNIRLTALGNADSYAFQAKRIVRENESHVRDMDPKPLGVWRPNKPKKESRKRIEELDDREKEAKMQEREEQIKAERQKKEMKQIGFAD